MHHFTPTPLSGVDLTESSMLALLLRASGVSIAPLDEPGASTYASVRAHASASLDDITLLRCAARVLRDRCIALGADRSRYESMAWRSLGL